MPMSFPSQYHMGFTSCNVSNRFFKLPSPGTTDEWLLGLRLLVDIPAAAARERVA